jgi:hypothetical protein
MGVDLSGLYTRMPEQILEAADVGAGFEEVSGKRMSQDVRGYVSYVQGYVTMRSLTTGEWTRGIVGAGLLRWLLIWEPAFRPVFGGILEALKWAFAGFRCCYLWAF